MVVVVKEVIAKPNNEQNTRNERERRVVHKYLPCNSNKKEWKGRGGGHYDEIVVSENQFITQDIPV
jgi:hypothetical protein